MDYFINVASKSLNKENEELCGDKVEVIRTDESVIIIMTDGLGSGVKANILANITCKVIGTMLKEGLEIEETVNTVIKTLPVCKLRKVAYCTFTILQIFYNGEAYIVEYDNPDLMIFRNGGRYKFDKSVRVIHGRTIKEARIQVFEGDYFAIVSDGFVHAGEGNKLNMGWQLDHVSEFIEHFAKRSCKPDKIVETLTYTCDGLYGEIHQDDATAVVASIDQANPAKIMIGPPKSSEMDKFAVNELFYGRGIKIVCGGTTSRIVERYKLENNCQELPLYLIGSDIPPVTKMQGIDLVTEGVLTLSKVDKILNSYMEDINIINELSMNDGAERLASILINDATDIKFLIGHAENEANRDSYNKINFNYKICMIECLIKNLRGIGKRIEIIHY